LAEVVDKLGGEASDESAADGLGNKVSGAFRALVGGAVKYGLVSTSKGRIKTESLYQDYKLAYDDASKLHALRTAFLSAPLFNELVGRLNGQPVPSHLEKLMIREYEVPPEAASRIVQYFIEGSKEAGILSSATGLISLNPAAPTDTKIIPGTGQLRVAGSAPTITNENYSELAALEPSPLPADVYTVRIFGPGIDTKITIKEEEDLEIVEVTLRKVKRLLKEESNSQSTA